MNIKDFIASDRIQEIVGPKTETYRKKWSSSLKTLEAEDIDDPKVQKRIGQKVSWNWAAFVFNMYWAAWRGTHHHWVMLAIWCGCILAGAFFPSLMSKLQLIGFVFAGVYGAYGNSYYLMRLAKSRQAQVADLKPSIKRLVIAIVVSIVSFIAAIAIAIARI